HPHWVMPFTRVDSHPSLKAPLGRNGNHETVDLEAALASTLRGFQSDDRVRSAERKHVILISTGDTVPGKFEDLLQEMTAEGIGTSVICLSCASFDAALMARIAAQGRGRFKFTNSPENIPALLAHETRRCLRD